MSVFSMASTLLSPKYCRDASSSASCHISCHRMAMRMSSVLTCTSHMGVKYLPTFTPPWQR